MVADSTYFRAQEAAGRGQPIESHSSLRIRLLPCSLTAASASRTGAEVGTLMLTAQASRDPNRAATLRCSTLCESSVVAASGWTESHNGWTHGMRSRLAGTAPSTEGEILSSRQTLQNAANTAD